jgi:acyl dehydratase
MSGSLREPDFAAPPEDRYFEDYVPGSVHEYGHLTVSADEIVEFATRYDPQTMHTDPAAAAAGPFGGLIASGWHTTALMMRLFAAHYLSTASVLPSPGVDELRWTRPVRPGDCLSLRATVVDTRRSNSKPDRGIIRTRIELLNATGETVLTGIAINLMLVRPVTG